MTTQTRSVLALAGFVALAFAASALGGFWTYQAIPTWYQEIALSLAG